MILYNI